MKYEDKNIINFSEVDKNNKILFTNSFNYINDYFVYQYSEILNDVHKNEIKNTLNANITNQESINLAKFFGYYLWGFRKSLNINGIKISKFIHVNSIYEMSINYLNDLQKKISELKIGESILILQKNKTLKFLV